MKRVRSTIAFLSGWVGAVASAFGAAGEFGPPVVVTPLQTNVTYSTTTPALSTYAGFTVSGFANVGTNTVNDVTVMFEAKVTDGAESLALHQPEVYLSALPAGCSWPTGAANAVKITCHIRQMRAGDAFPGFVVFYKMPVKVINGVADANDDWISTSYTLQYAEGLNDCANGCANSLSITPFPNQVLLGTANPVDIKSGVPQNGAKLFTGTGVPKNEPDKKFTSEVLIPSLANAASPITFAKSSLAISWVASTDTTYGVQCGNLGNFVDCPTYTTAVVDPNSADAPVTFTVANPLRITYRIDGANVKRAASQLFNNAVITYYPDDNSGPVPVPKTCTNGQASANGVPCVLSFQCYKPGEKTPDLARDCEFVTIGLRNGRLSIL